MNPFTGRRMPINDKEKLFFREKYFEELEDRIAERMQTAVLGVKGCGKTSLLQSFFCREYRIRVASVEKEKGTPILISPLSEFPTHLNSEMVYHHFADMVVNSVRILSQCGKKDEMDEILAQLENIRLTSSNASSRLDSTIDLVHNTYGYYVIMLIDQFEHFTSSSEVTMDHHNLMKSLVEKEYFQFIIATNYDLNKDSLPPHVTGSHFISRFADNEICLKGWDLEEAKMILQMRLEDNEIQFSDALIEEKIYPITGGIPELLNHAAAYAYDYIAENGTEDGIAFRENLYFDPQVQKLFKNWCTMLSEIQIKAIREMLVPENDGHVDALDLDTALRILDKRGVVEKHRNGSFSCNSKLFRSFCIDGNKMEQAAAENPLLHIVYPETNSEDLQGADLETLIHLVREKIVSGEVSAKKLREQLNSLAMDMPNVTMMVDMTEQLDDEILNLYMIDADIFNMFDPAVQEFIHMGIQMDRMFGNVILKEKDYSVVYLSFAKAVETHLNLTLVPIFKKVLPEHLIDYKGQKIPISQLPADATMMLGTINFVFSRNVGLAQSGKEKLIRYCKDKDLKNFPENWWESLANIIRQLPDYRNKCPHCSILDDAEGKDLLQLLFSSASGDPTKNFMVKLIKAYHALIEN